MIDKIVLEGIENGEFSNELDVRLARQMIFGTIDEMATSWVMNEEKYDLKALASHVHQLLINGCEGDTENSIRGGDRFGIFKMVL